MSNYEGSYKKISHAERIDIIYKHSMHRMSMKKLSVSKGIGFNSVRNVIDAYKETGRTNRKNYKTVWL